MIRHFADMAELSREIGGPLGVSDWLKVDQAAINSFADAVLDHQWVHVNAERAARSPVGTTIAHGYYTLSLIAGMTQRMFEIDAVTFGLCYGADRVRFTAPVPVDSSLRLALTLTDVRPVADGYHVYLHAVMELDSSKRPACVADVILRYYE